MKTVKLSVIVPDERAGMQRMLERELPRNSEIIYENWRAGLAKAKGDFVCLLEYDSGVDSGALIKLLRPFVQNPQNRQLAMVSPKVEFEDNPSVSLLYYNDPQGRSSEVHLSRVGCVPGAIIRRTSLIKYQESLRIRSIVDMSFALSLAFWEGGLRVMHDPRITYCSPSNLTERKKSFAPSEKVNIVWKRELIT